MSASAPASRPTRNTGSVAAVWTRPTRVVDVVRPVISHAAATDWTSVPRFETRLADQIARNAGMPRGASNEDFCDGSFKTCAV
jgi:hypothetical protein